MDYDTEYIGAGKVATKQDGTVIQTKNGPLLKIGIKYDEHVGHIERSLKNGWLTLTIGKRKEPSAKGSTHWVAVDIPKDAPSQAPADDVEDDLF